MEEFVESEPVDGEIRFLEAIDDAAYGIEQAPDKDEREDCDSALAIELRQIDESNPTESDIERHIEPSGRIDPSDSEYRG